MDANTTTIVTQLCAFGITAIGLILTYLKASSAKEDVAGVKEDTAKAKETLTEIHIAVNSKETITAKKLEDQNIVIRDLSNHVATLLEQVRGKEIALEVARAVSTEQVKSAVSKELDKT